MFKPASIAATAVAAAFSAGAAADLVVLQYHHVDDQTPAATSTTPSLFRKQLDMIEELELEVVALDAATRRALDGELQDAKQVAITFEDAYESVYSEAAPKLEERGYPFTIFVNTDAIGSDGYMTWEQLEELLEDPDVLVANHSESHGHLARETGESRQDWEGRIAAELDSAQKTLEERLSVNQPLFAYPYGEFDEGLEKAIAERGWMAFGQQSGPIGEHSANTRLPRFPMATAFGQLSSLEEKLTSRALPVDATTLPDVVINENPPAMPLALPENMDPGRLTCFASGKGQLDLESASGNEVTVQAADAFDSRRFRYNCTYPAGEGRFYWLSQQWLDLSQPRD